MQARRSSPKKQDKSPKEQDESAKNLQRFQRLQALLQLSKPSKAVAALTRNRMKQEAKASTSLNAAASKSDGLLKINALLEAREREHERATLEMNALLEVTLDEAHARSEAVSVEASHRDDLEKKSGIGMRRSVSDSELTFNPIRAKPNGSEPKIQKAKMDEVPALLRFPSPGRSRQSSPKKQDESPKKQEAKASTSLNAAASENDDLLEIIALTEKPLRSRLALSSLQANAAEFHPPGLESKVAEPAYKSLQASPPTFAALKVATSTCEEQKESSFAPPAKEVSRQPAGSHAVLTPSTSLESNKHQQQQQPAEKAELPVETPSIEDLIESLQNRPRIGALREAVSVEASHREAPKTLMEQFQTWMKEERTRREEAENKLEMGLQQIRQELSQGLAQMRECLTAETAARRHEIAQLIEDKCSSLVDEQAAREA